MNANSRGAVRALVAVSFATSFTCSAHGIVITDLGTLGSNTQPNAVNNSGQVTGTSNVGGVGQAFIWQNGSMQGIGGTSGSGINEAGHVAGFSGVGASGQAFLWKNGTTIPLGTLGGSGSSFAEDVNDSDEVVGFSNNQAFIWQDGGMSPIGRLPGDSLSFAFAINNNGVVVGSSFGDGAHAFKWQNGRIAPLAGGNLATDVNDAGLIVGASSDDAVYWNNGAGPAIPLPDLGYDAIPQSVNEAGHIVGTLYLTSSPSGGSHAGLWLADHTLIDLQDLAAGSGWTLTHANGINDYGQIVGEGFLEGVSGQRAWTMTIPAPGALPLLIMAAFTTHRRRSRSV